MFLRLKRNAENITEALQATASAPSFFVTLCITPL